MQTTIAQMLYTLRRIHTYGRESIENLLAAVRLLETWDPENPAFPARALLAALSRITVTNAADADRLLGCMQAADPWMEEDRHDGNDQQG